MQGSRWKGLGRFFSEQEPQALFKHFYDLTPRPLVAFFRILRAPSAKLSGQDILAADRRRS
jgi:hypothetical protein